MSDNMRSDDNLDKCSRFPHSETGLVRALGVVLGQLVDDVVAFNPVYVLQVGLESIESLRSDDMNVLSCFRHKTQCLFGISIRAYQGGVARDVVRDDRGMDVPAEYVGHVDTLGSILADNSLTLLLICGVHLVTMHAQEGLIVQLKHHFIGLELVEAHPGILGGLDNIYIKPGTKLLYLGAAAGTTVSHCSDVVGPEGLVYAVEFSHRPGRDLVNMAKKRTNIIPIIEDARHPIRYRMLVGMCDTIFADVAQPDQARIVALNAQHFLKPGGNFIISIKASCIDSTVPAEAVFAREVKKLQQEQFKPAEQLTLEPYERDHAIVCGSYRVGKKKDDK